MQLAEGVLNRLVRAQLSKPVKENGKLVYHLRIDNASPLILNGLAAVGTTSKADEIPRVLSGISVPPRKSMTVSASAEVVKALSLKQGVKLVALDLSEAREQGETRQAAGRADIPVRHRGHRRTGMSAHRAVTQL